MKGRPGSPELCHTLFHTSLAVLSSSGSKQVSHECGFIIGFKFRISLKSAVIIIILIITFTNLIYASLKVVHVRCHSKFVMNSYVSQRKTFM